MLPNSGKSLLLRRHIQLVLYSLNPHAFSAMERLARGSGSAANLLARFVKYRDFLVIFSAGHQAFCNGKLYPWISRS